MPPVIQLCNVAECRTTCAGVFQIAVPSAQDRSMQNSAAFYGLIIHSNECYGNMPVYLRLKGLVSPSTEAIQRGRMGRGR